MKRILTLAAAIALTVLAVTPAHAFSCYTICQNDFKACRDSCHSLTCYRACQDGLDTCYQGCGS